MWFKSINTFQRSKIVKNSYYLSIYINGLFKLKSKVINEKIRIRVNKLTRKVIIMDEFEFIDSVKPDTYRQESLQKGIGDDAAVFRVASNDIVTAVDTFVENIHFSPKTIDAYHIGYRALAANMSDMAAMGAVPKFYLVSITIPGHVSSGDLKLVYDGMKEIASTYKMDLIGGDTVSGDRLVITITVIGFVVPNKARYRSVARHQDIVFVTGTLGNAQAGLHILMNDLAVIGREKFIKSHQKPIPRVAFATSLQSLHRLALNDISDGIANELQEIAVASNVNIIIEDDKIPIHPHLQQFSLQQQFEWKYFGGEDFELVGTVPSKDWEVVKENAKKHSLLITKIGTVTNSNDKSGQVYVKKNNHIQLLKKQGYVHKVGERSE